MNVTKLFMQRIFCGVLLLLLLSSENVIIAGHYEYLNGREVWVSDHPGDKPPSNNGNNNSGTPSNDTPGNPFGSEPETATPPGTESGSGTQSTDTPVPATPTVTPSTPGSGSGSNSDEAAKKAAEAAEEAKKAQEREEKKDAIVREETEEIAYEEKQKLDEVADEIQTLRSELSEEFSKHGHVENMMEKVQKLTELDKELAAARKTYEDAVAKYERENEEKKNTENAQTGGDPVRLTNGNYEQSETDIIIGGELPFEIQRKYVSGNSIVSSFGYGWQTNLDQRVILGINPTAQNEYNLMLSYLEQHKQNIDDTEQEIINGFKVSSIENGEDEISDCIQNLNTFANNTDTLCDNYTDYLLTHQNYTVSGSDLTDEELDNISLDEIKARFRGEYSELSIDDLNQLIAEQREDGRSLTEEIAALSSDARAKAGEMGNILYSFRQSVEVLAQMKAEFEQRKLEARQYYETEVAPGILRHQKNLKALFNGMDESYEGTGLNSLNVIDENGYPHILYETEKNSGVWKNPEDKTILSVSLFENGYRLTMYDGTYKDFDVNGFIRKITDRNGNYIEINRNPEEKITDIEASSGEKFTFDYNGNYIATITNIRSSDGNVVYSYSGNKLEAVKDTDGDTVSMHYDDNGRMNALIKCDGSTVNFVYGEVDAEGNVLTTATVNEEGFSEQFRYDRRNNHTDYIDHDGNKTSYWYDEKNRTVREVQPDGNQIITEYNDFAYTVTIRTNGTSTVNTYDEKDNLLRTDYPDGSYESWTYDSFNLVTTHRERDGVRESFIRDDKGNLREYYIDDKLALTQVPDSKGRVKKQVIKGQKDKVTEYQYDDFGNLKSEACGGVTTSYEYDKRNRIKKLFINDVLVTEYDYKGKETVRKEPGDLVTTYLTNGRKDITEISQKDEVTGVVHKTRIEYDKRHLPVRVFTGDGKNEKLTASYLYTAEGKLRAEISHGTESWIKLYEYQYGKICEEKQFKTNTAVVESADPDRNRRLENTLQRLLQSAGDNVYIRKYKTRQAGNGVTRVTVTDGLDIQNLFEYDSFGNLIKYTDGNGEVRERRFRNGMLREEQDSYGGWYEYAYTAGLVTGAGEKNGKVIETRYYSDGSVNWTVDRYGIKTVYNYDSRGRVSDIQNPSQKIWYEHDDFDRVTKLVVGNTKNDGSAVYYATYEYSADGRSVTVTEGGKYKTEYQLDAFGNVLKQTDGNGNTKRFEYDCQNQLTVEYDGYDNKTSYQYNALGKVSRVVLPDGAVSEYKYNYFGFLEKVTDDCGVVYTASYDKAGRLVKERNRADSEKTYEYNNGGRIKKVWCGGEVVESYTYTDNGRVVTVKDGNGNNYLYNYDLFGRLKNERNRKGLVQQYAYDDDGQIKSQSSFDGSSTTIVYSSDRTVRTVKYSDGSENRFVYDMAGNLIEAQNAYGKTLYQYDRGGRLVYQKDMTTGEEIRFEYDEAGNRTRLYSSNRDTSYAYGSNNEVKEIFDNKQRVSVKLAYNKNGSEVLRKFGNGTSEETLYDRAGRIIVKLQKSERNELLWAEGYVYGEDGKRTATVDNSGRVTLYEYNKKGQLQSVYYPNTSEMSEILKKEAAENGLPVNGELSENQYLSSELRSQIIPLLNSMQYGLAYSLQNLHSFIKESYVYDGNGNRTSKTTKLGTINYSYDSENCLIFSGSRGQSFVNYSYDNAGNLLTEESAHKSVKYAYNSQNRLIYCEVLDKAEKTYAQTTYAYDAFGRRILVQDKDEAALRTLYDGLTFDVIKQSPVMANGLFTDSAETGILWSRTGKPTGDRYRYISDEDAQDDNRYFYLDENTYKTVNTRYRGSRTNITVNGTIAARITGEGSQYFSTDLLGSVRSTTDSYGTTKSPRTYDAFGSLIQGDLTGTTDIGYLGKQHDPTAALYNYGYRDYKPASARFTTVDPIRDGNNWFAYCNGDPVNFVDLWGLCASDKVRMYVYRDKRSYDYSTERDSPKNTKLDSVVLYNTETNEYKVFKGVQTVANYPSTDANGNTVNSYFMDTIGTCNFELLVYTTTNVAGGTAAAITNTTTIDGRKVDAKGYTEQARSEGRGLVHSDEKPDGSGDSYLTPYSKQCFIFAKEDNDKFFETLNEWNVSDRSRIKGTVYDVERR